MHNSENRSCRAAGTPHLLHFTGQTRRYCSGSAGVMRQRWSSSSYISVPDGRCRCTLHPGGQSWAATTRIIRAAAVTLDLVAVAARSTDGYVRVKSRGFNKLDVIDLATAEPQAGESTHSASLIRGIAEGFRAVGRQIGGFDAYTASDVLRGSGLSSSAAFEMGMASIWNEEYSTGLTPAELAGICQYAENTYFGKPS